MVDNEILVINIGMDRNGKLIKLFRPKKILKHGEVINKCVKSVKQFVKI